MKSPARQAWLRICAGVGDANVLRHALEYQQGMLKRTPNKAMKVQPWLELRKGCGSVKSTQFLLELILLNEHCYFEIQCNRAKGRPKADEKHAALELASFHASGLSTAEFAKQSRKRQCFAHHVHMLEHHMPYAREQKRHTRASASHILRRDTTRNALRVLYDLQGIAQAKFATTAAKQRLARAKRLKRRAPQFAALVNEYSELLQLLPGDK